MKFSNPIDHVAIIMDGNARWAKKKNINKKEGYKKGLDKIKEITDICLQNKIKFLTLFALSSENIKRLSVNIIFDIISNDLNAFLAEITNNNKIRVKIIGNKDNLPKKILQNINKIEKITKENRKLNLHIAFNYGSKNEIIDCFSKLLKNKNIKKLQINENLIRDNLYVPNIPDPDILIRTGGFKRLSNFLLFQLSYTELFFTKTLWPDLSKNRSYKHF